MFKSKNKIKVVECKAFLCKSLWIPLLFLGTQLAVAQKKDETIGTEVVNVVKPYTPTISDAFKVKETPTLDDEETSKKEPIEYTIFSFPVASTFTPAKGKAAGVDKAAVEKSFSNYATLGIGNYGTLNAELFVTQNLSSSTYFGAMLRHLSSQGGIKNLELNDKYYNTSLDLTYGNNLRDLSWNIDLGFQNQIYNWYGLPADFGNGLLPEDRSNLIRSIDPKQIYNDFYLGGKITFKESIFKEMTAKFDRFWDGYTSIENRFYVKPSFEFELLDEKIKTNVIVDYIGGSFNRNYFSTHLESLNYGYVNLGFNPNYNVQKDYWSLNLGVNLFYSSDTVNNKGKFYVYPQINGTYKLVGDLMLFYAGAEGGLEQNSYHDFANANPFVSPTIGVTPTDKQYDIFAGLKGKLANTMSYNVQGSYRSEKNKALFLSNDYSLSNTNTNGYAYGNSVGIVYDGLKTLQFFGELKADFSKKVSFGINGTFNTFTTSSQERAWNLPVFKASAILDFVINTKWYAGTSLYFVGDRKDKQVNLDIVTPSTLDNTKTISSYFDVNAHVGFKYNNRLTAFLKLNNIANQHYQKWLNYPVQGFQILLGANYKFDF